jgi:hypothetical protein
MSSRRSAAASRFRTGGVCVPELTRYLN